MKKFFSIIILLVIAFTASAQIKFGFLSYNEALKSMPENKEVEENLAYLREQYSNETLLSEQEFNQKYESFLEGQNTFEPSILRKRQAELQELLSRSISFKKEAERLLKEAEKEYYAPLKEKLDYILQQIGTDKGYAFIINTDNNGMPFANLDYGEDILLEVIEILKQ